VRGAQGAGATNRKRIEAAAWDEQAKKCQAQYLPRNAVTYIRRRT
jgi:hypothetical protein